MTRPIKHGKLRKGDKYRLPSNDSIWRTVPSFWIGDPVSNYGPHTEFIRPIRKAPGRTFYPGTMKARIYYFLRQRAGRTFTMWEVAKCLGLDPAVVSARMNELATNEKGIEKQLSVRTNKCGILYRYFEQSHEPRTNTR